MKKALILTDASVDIALSLNRWLDAQPEPIDLTVVYAFALDSTDSQSLQAATYQTAKQAASQKLEYGLTFLSQTKPNLLHAELLPGDPALVLTIHLLLRRYDYLLIDPLQPGGISTFRPLQHQLTTQLQWLNMPETPLCLLDSMADDEYNSQVA